MTERESETGNRRRWLTAAKYVAVIAGSALLALVTVMGIGMKDDMDAMTSELSDSRSEVESLETELEHLRAQTEALAVVRPSVQSELDDLKNTLFGRYAHPRFETDMLGDIENRLNDAEGRLDEVESCLANLYVSSSSFSTFDSIFC